MTKLTKEKRLIDLGFEAKEYDQLQARGCRVMLYQVGPMWQLDIVLRNGSTIRCDVPVTELRGERAD